MNIEILQEHINTFAREVIDTGFKRDLDDYKQSLPAAQSNIVAQREIAGKVQEILENIYSGDLPQGLKAILLMEENAPFTETPYNEMLGTLIENTEIQQEEFFQQLTGFLNKLRGQVRKNNKELDEIQDFIAPYISEDVKRIAKDHFAIVAIIFNEHQTITNLKQFTKTLSVWNRVLSIYHQLIKSESPEDVEIVEIQNGSIEFVVNLNIGVALDLVKLFTVGFKVFAAYLAYKEMIKPIVDSYYGNKKLLTQENEREKLLLENIGTAIKGQVDKQHKKAKKKDGKVDTTAVAKKVEQVVNLIASHIINGNDLKLLALPEERLASEEGKKLLEEKNALRDESIAARRGLRQVTAEVKQKLLGTYGKIEEEEAE
jgi:hypothetical protein